MDILDTAGQQEFRDMRMDQTERNYRKHHEFILMFSITDRQTFDEIESLYLEVLRAKDKENVPVVIIGQKCDLSDERVVSNKEGKELAQRLGNKLYIEASSKIRKNIDESIHALVRELRKSKEQDYIVQPRRHLCVCLLM